MAKDEDKRTVNDLIVKTLEELLEQARAGDIIGLAVVAAHPDKVTLPSTYLQGIMSDKATLGGLEELKFRVLRLL